MKRWSKLQKRFYELVDEGIDFQIHCAVYRMQSRRGGTLAKFYPYDSGISGIGELIREYIDTPKDELFKKHFDTDEWGLANILKAADKRIGKMRLQILAKNKKNQAMQKVVQARLNYVANSKTPEFKREI